MKRTLKRCAQVAVAQVAPFRWRLVSTPMLVVLMYHRVLPAGDERLQTEQPGMWVRPETFRMHVRTLKQHFEVVRLSDWLARAARGDELPPRACAITFDDGWRDNYEYAYPILSDEGARATVFLVSDVVGTNQAFWPERLARFLRFVSQPGQETARRSAELAKELCPSLSLVAGADMSVELIDDAINRAKVRYSDEEIHTMLDENETRIGLREKTKPSLVNWQEVREMVRAGVIDIGSHTRRHVRMSSRTSKYVMRDEIVESKRVLEEKTDTKVELFCYPNGDITPDAYDMVKATYSGACSTRRGWNSASADPFALRRVGVHQDIAYDRASFVSRISAWL